MGEVLDGWDRRLSRPVAIKLLRPELAAQPGVLQRFEAEARAAATLSHPNVVQVFDSGKEAGTSFIVMERLPSRTLADELAAGPLEPERVRAILADILEALAAAHRRGIIHRDIKPSNVLFTETGTTKVADFGIAKSAQADLTQTGQLLGTLSYLSPEQLDGSPATAQSDLYSAGVVGYEALTGRRPFTAETPLALVRAIAQGPRSSIKEECPGVDEDLCEAIDRALQPSLEARFASAEEMLAALKSSGQRKPTLPVATPPAATRETEQLVSPGPPTGRLEASPAAWFRHPDRRVLVGALAVLLLLLALFLPDRGDSSRPESSATAPVSPSGSPPRQSVRPDGVVAEVREVQGFRAILFRGPGRLVIEQTGSESLTIEAEKDVLPLIGSEVIGGRLTLGPKPGAVFPPGHEVVYLLKLKQLDNLEALGSGAVVANQVDADRLTLVRSGSGDSVFAGNADYQEVSISGSGNYDGARLVSKQARVDISGSGGAVVNVSQALDARVSGSGSIEYIGSPTVTKSVSGSGSVRER